MPSDSLKSAFAVCAAKARGNLLRLAAAPKAAAFAPDGDTFAGGDGFFDIGNWTSSFHTGMALLAMGGGRDSALLGGLGRLAESYRLKVTAHRRDTMHDLGFLYLLYSVPLYRLTGEAAHRETALLAAEALADRFVEKGGYLRAWGAMDETNTGYAGLAIIDSLMNLPLLFWAERETGRARFREIAVRHADTTLARFVRADDSVCHACRFDPSGAFVRCEAYAGWAPESHWARGTAWALYGFALAHRFTGDKGYLSASRRLARKFAALVQGEWIPPWDFRLPNGAPRLPDASAAAIAVCGIDALVREDPSEAGLRPAAESMLERLLRPDQFDDNPAVPGILMNAQVGDGPGKARNAYASWGDYFLMEALARRLHGASGYGA